MGDLDRNQTSDQVVSLVGNDEQFIADVILEDGLRKLAVSKLVQVDSLSGRQISATNYFFVDATLATGSTLRIEIDATEGAPALDKSFTSLAGETGIDFITRVILELNQDFVNFQPYWRALDIDDNPAIFIASKNVGESGENTNVDSFRVTGTSNPQRAFADFVRRGTVIQASSSTTDPRLGIFGITGSVEAKDASVEGLFIQQPYNGTPTTIDLNVNGSGTPVVFTFPMDNLDDLFVNEIKFFGRDNGIQFSNFLGQNGSLTNGILVEIKTDNNIVLLPPIRTTDDFDDVFAFGGSNFDVYFASGDDKFSARFLASAFPLRRSGTFGSGNDDYIRVTIRDNLTSINYLQCIVGGFRQEA